jgi:hypothetical protein
MHVRASKSELDSPELERRMANAVVEDLLQLLTAGFWLCAPKARITSGGRFHPDSCRLIWKLTSGSAG